MSEARINTVAAGCGCVPAAGAAGGGGRKAIAVDPAGKARNVSRLKRIEGQIRGVQKMVEESVEHAFEDLAARRWIEAKLKAKEALTATQSALAACGAELESDYTAQVNQAVQTVTAALATENAATGSGDLNALKAAVAGLDTVTKPLADLLMDRAMEAMLRKRGLLQ